MRIKKPCRRKRVVSVSSWGSYRRAVGICATLMLEVADSPKSKKEQHPAMRPIDEECGRRLEVGIAIRKSVV